MTKKLIQLLFDASSMSVSIETTQKLEKYKISTTDIARTNFFNEPESTCSYMHTTHFTC